MTEPIDTCLACGHNGPLRPAVHCEGPVCQDQRECFARYLLLTAPRVERGR